jgi:hypothetical protein
LKSPISFSLDGSVLGFYVRADGNNITAPQMGQLQIQLESSSPSRYVVTRSIMLTDILQAAEGDGAAEQLAAVASGSWAPIKVDLSSFLQDAAANVPGSFKADRLTMGLCLQQADGCLPDGPALSFCLDKIVIVTAA